MTTDKKGSDNTRLDQVVADAHRDRAQRELGYREQALKLYPWVCGRCGREFNRKNLQELTVHHRDHDHDNNPTNGSNWELLCLFCHDNEHQRLLEAEGRQPESGESSDKKPAGKHQPFADLKSLLKKD